MEHSSSLEAVQKAAPRLPISKVKRIAKCDPEHMLTSQSATAAVAFATELFVQVFSEEGFARSQLERPAGARLTLRYDDLSACVASSDRFAFLADVVPETQSLVSLTCENRVRYTTLAPGQTVLPFRAKEEPANSDGDGEEEPDEQPEAELDAEIDEDGDNHVEAEIDVYTQNDADLEPELDAEADTDIKPTADPEAGAVVI
ncbi:DNA polymerase epsilon noncatalytic subunit [Lachancea thermotolerans CBS 6340]|uniref:KLTH0H10890p n=1 Tax=Lachancea thermotolerans (strain ATCC 56472 / CBS 6340 / NRRL Y-8284) TaxID=559295 RepID=C5E372_LACTC|nr:KLTH0H10890p [Lachancea thermotolerans CBS 6340]CAR30483.1 KLTH0H10890p [Lachancea thermotolerans CBS 6340]